LDEFKKLYYQDPTRLYLKDNNRHWLPIHYATLKSKIKIIEFIIEISQDDSEFYFISFLFFFSQFMFNFVSFKQDMINIQDLSGNTPLHIAIEAGDPDCFKFLLQSGADITIKNRQYHAPIHQCILMKKPQLLDILLEHDSFDINLVGDRGWTALHYCAISDNLECAEILVKYDCNLCIPCNNGYYPIHVAAQKASNRMFEYLLSEGNKMGYTKLEMLSIVDSDNNKPLHAAVQFGNLEAIKMCLENGARLDEVAENDNQTPVHIACMQGSLTILKLIYTLKPDLFLEILDATDSAEMTPLHKAALFDHVEVACYLLEKGAYINSVDEEKRSPLMLAASRNCFRMVEFLLSKGADIKLKDKRKRNFLHLILDKGDSVDDYCGNTKKKYFAQYQGDNKIIEELTRVYFQFQLGLGLFVKLIISIQFRKRIISN
jgi:transient receptor potential cation channel subfamily A member 1